MPKKQIAPPVTDTKSKEPVLAEPPTPVDPSPAEPQQVQQEPEKPLTDSERLSKLETAMNQVDNNFKLIEGFLTKLEPLAAALEQRKNQTQNPQAQEQPALGGGLDINSLLKILTGVLGSGQQEGNSTLSQELTTKVIQAGINQMNMGTELLGAIQKKVLVDMGVKIGSQIADNTTSAPQ